MPIHKRQRDNAVHYTAVVRVVGQPVKSKTFRSHKDAKRWLDHEKGELAKGKKILESKARETTLGQMLPLYAEKVVAKRGRTSTSSRNSELSHVLQLAGTFLAERKVSEIDAEDIEAWLAQRRACTKKNGEAYADSTHGRALSVLASALNFSARELGIRSYRRINPCYGLDKGVRPAQSAVRQRNLREGEYAEFERQLALYQEGRFTDAYNFSIRCGLRRGELVLLNKAWINWEDGLVIYPITKTGRNERRPLTPSALAILRRIVPVPDGRFFPFPPDRITSVTRLLSERASIMLVARRYEGGKFATAIQLYLLVPQLKVEELAALRFDRIDWVEGVLKFDNPRSSTLRRREVQADVMAYVRGLAPANEKYYFVHTETDLKHALEYCTRQAGAIGTFCHHVIRAAVTTSMVKQNISGPIIGQFTGHRDERSRQRYTRLDPVDVARRFGALADSSLAELAAESRPSRTPPIGSALEEGSKPGSDLSNRETANGAVPP
ncbi:MAG: hypothetical protein OSA97_02855 [Nevskia sp.]|nr:hypothetical protein [Nevskia sp.]